MLRRINETKILRSAGSFKDRQCGLQMFLFYIGKDNISFLHHIAHIIPELQHSRGVGIRAQILIVYDLNMGMICRKRKQSCLWKHCLKIVERIRLQKADLLQCQPVRIDLLLYKKAAIICTPPKTDIASIVIPAGFLNHIRTTLIVQLISGDHSQSRCRETGKGIRIILLCQDHWIPVLIRQFHGIFTDRCNFIQRVIEDHVLVRPFWTIAYQFKLMPAQSVFLLHLKDQLRLCLLNR